MKVSKSELENALAIVKPGLASKEVLEQSTSFAFIKGRVITFNDSISLSHKVEGLEELDGAIPAENLYKLLSKVKTKKGEDDMMELSVVGNELILTQGKMKAGFALEAEIKLAIKSDVSEIGDWHELPADFNDLLDQAWPSCSTDMSDPIMTCVNVTKEGVLIGSDGFRVSICTLSDEMPVETFVLPATAAKEVTNLKPDLIATGKGGWIHFRKEDTILSCRIFEESYPPAAASFEVKGRELILPESLPDVLERAGIFAKKDHEIEEKVDILIENKKMFIKAEAEDGWIKEELNINCKEKIEFSITPYLLERIIKANKRCIIGEDKLKFEGTGWIYIAALRS